MADSAVHKCKTAASLAKLKDQMSEVQRGREMGEYIICNIKENR